LNLSSGKVQRFSLRSPLEKIVKETPGPKVPVILLVEDSRADAGLVREALEEHRVEADLVLLTDGETAVDFIQALESCPELVIVDLNLPKRSGLEVLKALRESVACREAPVVVLSSSDDAQDKNDAASLGASRYIRKPSRLEEFVSLGAIFKSMIGGFIQ
jgi:DNA-binding response OmpR family regulator